MLSTQTLAAVGLAFGLALTPTIHAQQVARHSAVPPRAELALGYSFMRANASPGNCGCFNLNGGSAEVAVRAFRNLSAVVDVTGEHAGTTSVPNQALSLVLFTAGPRLSLPLRHRGFTRATPFVQGLVGAVHGFDAPYPGSSGTTGTSATNLAVLAGGGVDINLSRRLALRAVQADYGLTHLPNNSTNSQNLLRIAAGIVFRLH